MSNHADQNTDRQVGRFLPYRSEGIGIAGRKPVVHVHPFADSIKRGNATLFLSGAFFPHPHHRRVSLSQLPGAGRATPAPILLIRTRMRLIRR